MADGTSLINLGELSKPVTVLIEKVSAAVGVVFEPTRIVRKANAEAKADIIKANAGVEIRDIEKRAIDRLIFQETRKQENIESITFQAATNLSPDAKVEMLDVDWVTHFFKHCDTVSDVEMQTLWARVLTGEATKSGTFSKRTVQFISTLDKSEAELFTKLCQFVWVVDEPFPYITDEESEIYLKHGINFYSLAHLKSIGLIVYEDVFSRPCKIQIHDQSTIRRQTLCAIRRTNTHPTTHRRLYSHQNFAQRKPAKGFDPLCHNRSQ